MEALLGLGVSHMAAMHHLEKSSELYLCIALLSSAALALHEPG